MRSNLKLATTGDPPPRSAERQTLAEAIDRHREENAHLESLRAALENISGEIFGDAGAALSRAEAALVEAKADESRHLAAVALGQAMAEDPVKAATLALEDARGKVDKLRKTRTALEAEQKAAERALMYAEMRRDEAVSAAVKADPAVRQLVAAFNEAERNYMSLRQVMGIVGTERLPDEAKFWDSIHRWSEMPGAAQWKAALAALRTDADAALPE